MGLFIGKQIGVFGFTWIALKLKWAKIPEGCNMMAFYGVSLLTGVGFTMSLFISSLAFDGGASYGDTDKQVIIMGSFLSAFIGFFVLSRAIKSFPSATPAPAKMKKHHAQKATD
jgi:NhaA family Na+:H+ antiporter